jgi:diguanylate cyclase (GGDEF)-like protein
MTVIVVGIVLTSVVAVTTITFSVVKRHMQAQIGAQQYALISTVASALDQKLELRSAALRSLTDGVSSVTTPDRQSLQTYLALHKSLESIFDNISIFDSKGYLQANLHGVGVVGQFNAASRLYFVDTMKYKKGVISSPFLGAIANKSLVIMTQPVFGAGGEIQFIFAATIDLGQQNLLGQFATTKIGNTGYMYILSSDGIVIEHPKRDRILQNINAAGGYSVPSARAMAGFEGSLTAVNRFGVPGLFSFKRLKTTNWIVGAIYPTDEAFAPIRKLEKEAVAVGCLLACIAGSLAWCITRRQIRSLEDLKATIEAIRNGETHAPIRKYRRDEIGTLASAFEVLIAERRALEQELHAQARQDALTGLPNRLELMSRIHQAAARTIRSRKPFALLFLDLDGFKQINDLHGHQAGDVLLCEVSQRLQACVRKSDTVARLGGDEFTVIVENFEDDKYDIEVVAKKIINEMRKPMSLCGREVVITTSVGVAFWSDEQQTPEDLLAEADTAMYAAKAEGKDRAYIAPRAIHQAAGGSGR